MYKNTIRKIEVAFIAVCIVMLIPTALAEQIIGGEYLLEIWEGIQKYFMTFFAICILGAIGGGVVVFAWKRDIKLAGGVAIGGIVCVIIGAIILGEGPSLVDLILPGKWTLT